MNRLKVEQFALYSSVKGRLHQGTAKSFVK